MRRVLLLVFLASMLVAVGCSNEDPMGVEPSTETPSSISAQSAELVTFVPVQEGFAAPEENLLPYAPGRLLVKFSAESIKRAAMQEVAFQKGAAAPNARTGIASVDELGRQLGVTGISRPYIMPKDKSASDRLGVDRWFQIEMDPNANIMDAVARYEADSSVEYVSPDWRAFPAAVPSDPLYADHWGHDNTAQLPSYDWNSNTHTGPTVGTVGFDSNAEAAWDQGYGSSAVIIAIIDSGVDQGHPDLTQVAGYDYGDNDANPNDDSASPGHGTACAGVAASNVNNGIGVCGAAPGAVIMPLKVADSAGNMYFSAIQNALYHAADNGADIVSMSLGASISSDPATDAAIDYAYNAGVTILAATGNANSSTISYPAIHQNVIGVGAASPCGDRKRSSSSLWEVNSGVNTDPNGYTCDGERWWGSNYGNNTPDSGGAVDIIAPTILPTTDISGGGGYDAGDYYAFFNGTSAATPYAAGVCALIITANPGWSPAQVRDQLVNTAFDIINVESGNGWDRYSGYGMVDAAAAVGGGGPPVNQAPTANANGPYSGDTGAAIAFSSAGSSDPDGTIASYSWDFGDGGTSTQANPSYSYGTAGSYTVTLTVTDNQGATGANATTATITDPQPGNQAPTANANGPYSGDTGAAIAFSSAGSSDPDGTIASYSWDFGDGGTSTQANPSYSYGTAGSYTVTLTVTDNQGATGANATTATITDPPVNNPPVANFVGTPTSGTTPLTVAFTDNSIDAPTSWSWDFGDGGTSTAQNPSYTYTTAGTYTVSMTATNAYGSDTMTRAGYITVTTPPVGGEGYILSRNADFSTDDRSFTTGEMMYMKIWTDQVDFNDINKERWEMKDANGDRIRQDFTNHGDGTWTASFALSGLPSTLTSWTWKGQVEDNPGARYRPTTQVTVTSGGGGGNQAPTANANGTYSGTVGNAVSFSSAGSSDPDGAIVSYDWDFGDGATSTQANPSYTYSATGNYTVTLTVTDDQGAIGTDVTSANITSGGGGGTDVVVITKAEWNSDKEELKIRAESDNTSATLTAVGWGTLTYKPDKNRWELKVKNVTSAPATVTVTSDFGGSDTSAVKIK